MNEKEAIEVIKNIDVDYSRCKECVLDNETSCINDGMDCQLIAINTVLQLLEQKDKRIDELEKALVEEAIKSTEKINKAIKRIKETRLDYLVVGQEVLEILEGQV